MNREGERNKEDRAIILFLDYSSRTGTELGIGSSWE